MMRHFRRVRTFKTRFSRKAPPLVTRLTPDVFEVLRTELLGLIGASVTMPLEIAPPARRPSGLGPRVLEVLRRDFLGMRD